MQNQEFPGGLAVKDMALSVPWLWFNPWPGEFPHAVGVAKKNQHAKLKEKYSILG